MSGRDTILISILEKIASIRQKTDALDAQSGRKFNVFRIIRSGYEEASLHSAFIAELLNPNGTHMAGDTYLQIFLDMLSKITDHCIASECAWNVFSEKAFSEGRLDIVIEDVSNAIIIENKIYAQDQFQQLYRYSKYNKPHKWIFYLTLMGATPSDQSLGSNDSGQSDFPLVAGECQVWLLSYKDNILAWLEECLDATVDKAFIRVNIEQYMDLIRDLTGKGYTMQVQNEIIRIIKERPELIKDIQAAYEAVMSDKMLRDVLGEFLGNEGFEAFGNSEIYYRRRLGNTGTYLCVQVPRDGGGNIWCYLRRKFDATAIDKVFLARMEEVFKAQMNFHNGANDGDKIYGCKLYNRVDGIAACIDKTFARKLEPFLVGDNGGYEA